MDEAENQIKKNEDQEIQNCHSFAKKGGLLSWVAINLLSLYANYKDYQNTLYINEGDYRTYRRDNYKYFNQLQAKGLPVQSYESRSKIIDQVRFFFF